MDWKDVGQAVGKAAPLIGTLLGGPAGAAVGGIVASVLGTANKPDDVIATLRTDPEALAKVIEAERRHQTELARMTLEFETSQFAQTHETIRAELASENLWKSGWRPFYGWASGVVWLAMGLGVTYSTIFKPAEAPAIIEAVAALTGLFGVALTVLGINIHQRSQDKRRLLSQPEDGLTGALARLAGRGR